MYNFLNKIIFFVLGYIVFLLTISMINLILLKNSEFTFSDVDILIMGDSHNRFAINPSAFKNALNISVGGESYVPAFYKLKKIISKCSVDTVLLSLSPRNISSFNDKRYSENNNLISFVNRYYPLIDLTFLKNVNIEPFKFYLLLFKKIAFIPRNDHLDSMIGSFQETTESNLDIEKINKRVNRAFFDGNKPHVKSKIMLDYLDSIINICEKNSIKLYLISTPLHFKYYEAIPKIFKKEFQYQLRRLKEKNVPVYDYTFIFKEDSLFKDGDHLNINGANNFTKIIKGRLKIPPLPHR